jgi:hypothetical protein
MLTLDPRDALVLARERASQLRRERTAERLRLAPRNRRALAAWLRRAANLLDPAPPAPLTVYRR